MAVTLSPLPWRILAIDDEATPLPTPLITPPTTKIYLVLLVLTGEDFFTLAVGAFLVRIVFFLVVAAGDFFAIVKIKLLNTQIAGDSKHA